MSRLRRLPMVFQDTPLYFVTACTHQRRQILANLGTHQAFIRFCKEARLRGVWIGSYVLMPDHLHLFFCSMPEAMGLSTWMKSLKNSLSKHWRKHGVQAPHWQKGYFDHLLRSDESYTKKWGYVHQNPVRAGLVKNSSEWPYLGSIQNEIM